MNSFHTKVLRNSECLALAAGSGTVSAQAALEEVMVTATRRAETIQDVPISVAAVSVEVLRGPQGTLFGKNLSNEDYCAWCIPSGPNVLAAMNPPRELALQVRANF